MRFVLAFVAPGLLMAAVAHAGPTDLAGPWAFHLGDDPSWAQPGLNDRSWSAIRVPTGWGRESPQGALAWYRRRVEVDAAAARTPPGLAVLMGKVDSAYEIYAGGQLLGGVGSLPPRARMDYDRHRLYVLPPSAIGPDGTVVLALRVWKSPDTESSVGGPVEGRFLLGPSLELEREALLDDMLQLFLSALFILVGLYHLLLFSRRSSQREYLWYALVALDAGLYCFLRTQAKYALSGDFLLLKEIEYAILLVLAPLFVQFVWPLLGLRIPLALRLHQAASLLLAAVVALTPGLWLNLHVLPYWELSLLPVVALSVAVLGREAWRGQGEARTIAAGLGLFLAFALHDIAVDRGLASGSRVTAFGFATFVLSMAMSLANRFSRAHTELATLGRDLERRVVARTQELSRRTAEADAASEAKSQFLATMSHEIRTPLNAVIGMTGLMLDSPQSGEQRESLEIVRRSGETLLDLVNDILDFSKIESGHLDLEEQPFSLRACIEDALEVVAIRAAEKGLDLAYTADGGVPPLVRGDVTRVRQVLVNLVGNAAKFTPAGGVMVAAEQRFLPGGRPELHVSVTDTGIGVSPERRNRLFLPFSQVDASHTRQYGGTGLGLAISRRLCQLMGGTLWLGEEPGPGAVFHFAIPCEAVEAEIPPDLRAEQPDLSGKAALVVAAGPLTRRMLEACFRSWGMSARMAASDEDAVLAVRAGEARVVLIGFGADRAGARSAAALRELQPAEKLPFIAFGPLSSRQEMSGAARLGIVARLLTPLRPAHVHGALLESFGSRAAAARAPELPPVNRAPDDTRPLRILLAEDNVVNQKVVLQMLLRQGYRADVAGNGREVLEALGRQTYDVVLLDVQMPEMDGLETARRIRAKRERSPRLIALTANAMHGDREACLAAGMHDYLSKPVSPALLAAALRRAWPVGPLVAPETPLPVDTRPVVLARHSLQVMHDLAGADKPTFVSDLIQDFLRESTLRLGSMDEAIAARDALALQRLAHNLRGSAGMLGGRRLEASCLALELAARESAPPDLRPLLSDVRAELDALHGELSATLPSSNGP